MKLGITLRPAPPPRHRRLAAAALVAISGAAAIGWYAGGRARAAAGGAAVLAAQVVHPRDQADELDAQPVEDGAVSAGLGTLRARRPGSKDEIDGAVRLARNAVTVHIAGSMARTEVDETFVNATDQQLEGVWRFPVPADARLERLALEVDGKLVEGEFVDADRAAAIWRGVIQHAAPQSPRPMEELVWVPGPWRDPALLEWRRGGRAELKIFPIPRKGSRRVVLAYTQHVAPSGGLRRYVYPLAARPGQAPIDEASFDVQVLGADPSVGVQAHGYDLVARDGESGGSARLGMTRAAFTPGGDLEVAYATPDRATAATAFAYVPPGSAEDAFVTLALRPRLPPRIAARGRDQVVVVDVGRAMFGERSRRASRLAVTIAQQMDRRDRVAVVACDLTCRTVPGGFRAPGAAAAHDVDAFLAGIEADGASDLVGAVRAAVALPGRDPGHDLRVLLLSDGIASAGARAPSRVAAEVAEALSDARDEVVAVPIGSDADVDTMSEIARGGGGAVVAYAPGRSVDATSLEVLSATYGATIRDVALVLPDGLRDVAPGRLPALRAGAETLVAARMHGDRVAGDVVLRGQVDGEPFEARWPVDVRATSDEGNAWSARTWAAMRIADDERAGDGAARADAVALSRRFRVPSRLTSLLVLENEAMFRAFGVVRADRAFAWTGESQAQGTEVAVGAEADDKSAEAVDLSALAAGRGGGGAPLPAPKPAQAGGDPFEGHRAGPSTSSDARRDPFTPAPTATTSPWGEKKEGAPIVPLDPVSQGPGRAGIESLWGSRPRPGRWMRRVWFRAATVASDAGPAGDSAKIEAARAALEASPDARPRYVELARLLVLAGDVDAVDSLASRWSARDPLDVDALTLRATARAWRGDRGAALRILTGALASPSLGDGAQADMASALARAIDRAGQSDAACALRVAAAEAKTGDAALVASAVSCERARGRAASAERWLASAKDDAARARISAAAAKSVEPDALFGDVVVDATWDPAANADLDVGVIEPSGRRLSWASAARGIRARDAAGAAHEALAVSSGATGSFVVDVTRAAGDSADRPIAGKLRITSLGRTQVVPFLLTGTRIQVARVVVHAESRLEPATLGAAPVPASCVPPFFTDAGGTRRLKPGCQ